MCGYRTLLPICSGHIHDQHSAHVTLKHISGWESFFTVPRCSRCAEFSRQAGGDLVFSCDLKTGTGVYDVAKSSGSPGSRPERR